MLESVQLLCQLPYPHLQLLVLLLQLLGPLLGQQDPPAGLVPALSHGDVVPLAPQAILCTVLVDAPLVDRGPQSWQEERMEVLEVRSTNIFKCVKLEILSWCFFSFWGSRITVYKLLHTNQ